MKNELMCFDFLIKKKNKQQQQQQKERKCLMYVFEKEKLKDLKVYLRTAQSFVNLPKYFCCCTSVWRYKEEDFDQIVDEYFKSICRKTAQNLIISETY